MIVVMAGSVEAYGYKLPSSICAKNRGNRYSQLGQAQGYLFYFCDSGAVRFVPQRTLCKGTGCADALLRGRRHVDSP